MCLAHCDLLIYITFLDVDTSNMIQHVAYFACFQAKNFSTKVVTSQTQNLNTQNSEDFFSALNFLSTTQNLNAYKIIIEKIKKVQVFQYQRMRSLTLI